MQGYRFGAESPAAGEVVFTTGMTGYQEVLTDPSFTGQMVTMTAPHIGNTGINHQDPESVNGKPQVAGFIVREPSPMSSSWRSEEDFNEYLIRHDVTGIGGIDTRRLTRLLRDNGSQNGIIGVGNPDDLVDQARQVPSMQGLDLVQRVTPKEAYEFNEGRGEWAVGFDQTHPTTSLKNRPQDMHIVAMDFGAKRNIFRCLVDAGFRLTVVPAGTSAEEILSKNPNGLFLSSGPGDPAAVGYAEATIKSLIGKKPIFGICLGHQLLARALGAETYKLKFGHRGLNQPVKDLKTGRVEITTQNHGFVVDIESLKGIATSSHAHLNDGSSEGLEAPDAHAFSVQYHPEAASGPHDALYLFERFRKNIEEFERKA